MGTKLIHVFFLILYQATLLLRRIPRILYSDPRSGWLRLVSTALDIVRHNNQLGSDINRCDTHLSPEQFWGVAR